MVWTYKENGRTKKGKKDGERGRGKTQKVMELRRMWGGGSTTFKKYLRKKK